MFLQDINHVYTTMDGLLADEVSDIRAHNGAVYAVTRRGTCRFTMQGWTPVESAELETAAAPVTLPTELPFRDVIVHCVATDSSGNQWIGTDRGVMLCNSGIWREINGDDGLPLRDVRVISLGADGSAWFGGPRGVARLMDGRWRYYAGLRWLPDDRVNAITVLDNGEAWIATPRGVGRIEPRAITLDDKALRFEQVTNLRHKRRGYVAKCNLKKAGRVDTYEPVVTDNDGLWTAIYIVAQCFRHAVTANAEARASARESMGALLHLVDVTGYPGFPARCVVQKGEKCQGYDLDNVSWLPAEDICPGEYWKGDTSSDEIDGHYLAWYVYYAILADEDEKRHIEQACRAVTNNILDHGYHLVGPGDKPTPWGNWAPETLNDDPNWIEERGLNALEILSHLRVAMYICGDARFGEAYRELIEQHHYAINMIDQKVLPPRGSDNHSDDQLAWCAYYPLLMIEDDPALRRIYRLSLERTMRILRPEQSPLHDFLYAAVTGRRIDLQECIDWLQDSPWDLIRWTAINSHRPDVRISGERGRFGELQSQHVLPANERSPSRWNVNPYEIDTGSDGRAELDGTAWLLPYWFGRYYKLVDAD